MTTSSRASAPLRPCVSASGSTLLELIVVLAIIGLLFGVTIPALTALPETRSARSVADSLRATSAAEGRLVVGDSIVAFPDGRVMVRVPADAE